MDTINIAVAGADGVGKTSFVQQALRLPRLPTSNFNTMRFEVQGVTHIVSVVEFDLVYFDVDPGAHVKWPKQVNGRSIPDLDGALLLYDIMDTDSIRNLPPTLSALAEINVPVMLAATKCDNPEAIKKMSADGLVTMFPSVLADHRTSAKAPNSTREAFQAILQAAVNHRKAGGDAATRRRAASAAHLDMPPDSLNGRPISEHSKHSRASSDLSLLRGFPNPAPTDREAYYRGQNPRSSPRVENNNPNSPQQLTEESMAHSTPGMLRASGSRQDNGQNTFLDVDDESDGETYRYSDDIPILQRGDDSFFERPNKITGVMFDDLIDRLLAQKMTRAEANFTDVFLCLYRKFEAPGQLFSAILNRLDRAKEDKSAHYLTKTSSQLRIIEVIAKWVALYPGDFARSGTRRKLEELIRHLSTEPIFAMAALQMRYHLEQDVYEDDDTGWAKADEGDDSRAGPSKAPNRGSEMSESMKSLSIDDTNKSLERKQSNSVGGAPDYDADYRLNSKAAAQFQFHSMEDYEREAATMVPASTLPLNKIRYRIFMDLKPEDVADEITRIDWIMFSSVRIRDLVRSVSLSSEQKAKCRSLKNVNRMIDHFNHVAKWVANMILIRDKAKHRAPCLQKFMQIALRLRVLNNYNGLAAVLAGINGTAIHRLAQTRAMVEPEVHKRFARLGLLMGPQKSHFAYRLAWENSPLPRIPFMPLHRRDLVGAEEGSKTFVGALGDRVNWRKFEILGEVLMPIIKSQGTPYPNLRKHEPSRELVLDCRMPTDEEEIYQRSVFVEPVGGTGDANRKKFPWLAKVAP